MGQDEFKALVEKEIDEMEREIMRCFPFVEPSKNEKLGILIFRLTILKGPIYQVLDKETVQKAAEKGFNS
jgi:hypothetical protein